MRPRQFFTILLLTLLAPALLSAPAQAQGTSTDQTAAPTSPVDVMIVLDNSGSMKKNDPKFLMRDVVSSFADDLAPDSRLGIVVFDDRAELALGLARADASRLKDLVSGSLQRINYRGQRTDLPAGVERALYELRHRGRPEAKRVVVFLTDGIVDVGSEARNLEQSRWLRERLAQEAKELGIRIFGVAFTEGADFQLIQAVAQTTGGEYFRVLDASDIPVTFEKIRERIETISATAPQTPLGASQPSQPRPEANGGQASASWLPWLLAVVAALALGIVVTRALRGSKSAGSVMEMPVAWLSHLGSSSGKKYPLKKTVTHIGREERLNDIALNYDTVSSQHASIEFRDGAFYLKDLRSSNGTFLNGTKFSDPDSIREVVLKHGDLIRFDAYEFGFALAALEGGKGTRLAANAPAPRSTRLPAVSPVDPAEVSEPTIPHVSEPKVAASGQAQQERETKLKEMCPNHPSWSATDLCEGTCLTAYCKSCLTEKNGKLICSKCAIPA